MEPGGYVSLWTRRLTYESKELNPILDWVRETPILDEGGKPPQG